MPTYSANEIRTFFFIGIREKRRYFSASFYVQKDKQEVLVLFKSALFESKPVCNPKNHANAKNWVNFAIKLNILIPECLIYYSETAMSEYKLFEDLLYQILN